MADSRKEKKSRGPRAGRPAAAKPAPTTERVRDLAWAGQHAQAIELATAALATTTSSVAGRLDLLDLRAESFIAQGDLRRASADAAEMLDLANRAQRATYTCIGDTVNLAARLEAHTKVVQRAILIGQATRSALSERITVEPLGLVPFKGKAVAVEVFSVDSGQER